MTGVQTCALPISLSTIKNCSLFIDDSMDATSTFVQEGPTQFFYPYIPRGGWHNWSVCCYDAYLNYGCSENRSIYIKPPDLEITGDNIVPENSSPKIGQNITVNATIFNIGGSSAFDVIAQFYEDDPDSGGTQIGTNFTFNLTDINGNNSNITLQVSYVVSRIGPIQIFVVVDPPTATNGSIFELREYNNKNFTTLDVPSWHTTFGNVSALNVLGSGTNDTVIEWDETNFEANIFATETGLAIDWTRLQAISRKTDNTTSSNNDFEDIDAGLNMTGFADSVNATYTSNNTPKALMNFTLYSRQITGVPVVNSTNTSSFVTGILWDYSDGGAEYDGTQDIVFVTRVNLGKTGKYGSYDYEITYPSPLKDYKEAVYDTVDIYYEII